VQPFDIGKMDLVHQVDTKSMKKTLFFFSFFFFWGPPPFSLQLELDIYIPQSLILASSSS
jgi:hypothetical protein